MVDPGARQPRLVSPRGAGVLALASAPFAPAAAADVVLALLPPLAAPRL
jgi:hypothetical protein